MFLVDTSVWIEVFRKGSRLHIESVVPLDEMITCLPIIQEVLQGFRDDLAFRRAREAMLAFPCLESPLPLQIFEQAVSLFRSARRSGITVRSSVDCLIAATAIQHGVVVLHRDRDYANLAAISELKHRQI
ncbi:MAG: PIN domain-containing protein [Deltaproteobacteria bacterium]|nr:PIN domain-containing protein [Deltaproteobacteria bacterium]